MLRSQSASARSFSCWRVGCYTEEVAARIGLSAETVKSDTKRAIQKLEADTRVHAVAIALRKALIE